MRQSWFWLGSAAIVAPTAASAADQLKFGKPPEWVVEQAIPAASPASKDLPVALLLHDQQTDLKPGTITTFSEIAFTIQKPEGLAAGNLTVAWNPATDTITVNRLEIHRGTQVIDVLAGGQKFTTMRRETNLDLATLDGMLTANIQPEGLQQGDTLVLATTSEHSDPVLKGHVEATFAPWGSAQIALGHARVQWPSSLPLKVQTTGPLAAPHEAIAGGTKTYDLTMSGVEPVIPPKSAPVRYGIGRMGEATDFKSWAELARLMMPLYNAAAHVPATGPLHDEMEKIRAASPDPKTRAALALRLVQDRVRYVALLMGQGGLVPADAQTTWERRFGDCKAKTALLLALLHELGITAEPVAANVAIGDAIGDRLPMIALFNHVLVRARINGKDYWLDGTRNGDTDLDAIEVPDFGWVLPLTENAQLLHLTPAPLNAPSMERRVEADASQGLFSPSPVTITELYRNDSAVEYNNGYSQLSANQRDEWFRSQGKSYFDSFELASSSATFDGAKRQMIVVMKGTAKLNWNNGWFFVPTSSIAYSPDFERPAGALHDAPIKINHPRFVKDLATFKLPPGVAASQKLHVPVHETLAGVEYTRSETVVGDTLTVDSSERSVASEVSYKDAVAAAPRLRALDKDDVYLRMADSYRAMEKDWPVIAQLELTTADQYVDRGLIYANGRKFAEAIADYNQAMKLDPDNKWALSDRAIAEVWLQHYDEAQKDLATLTARDPDNAVALRAQGLMAEFKEDYAKAADFYTRSLATDPGNSFAIGHRAICEDSLSKNDEALADSATALKADPDWMDLRVMRANIFVRRGDNAAVAHEAELMTSENPRASYAYVAAGKIYARLSRTQDAMKAFEAALAIKPEAYIYLNRAQARPFTDHTGRMADLELALKLDSNNSDVLAEKAEQLAVDGNIKGAKEIYDTLIAGASSVRYYKTRHALYLFKTGAVEASRKEFDELRTQAKSASELNSLCWAKATGGILLDVARAECQEALRREPDSTAYLDSMALVELRLGEVDQAIADYTRAIAKSSAASSYMGRALAYARKGEQALANADLKHALQLDPDEETRFTEFGLPFGKDETVAAKGK